MLKINKIQSRGSLIFLGCGLYQISIGLFIHLILGAILGASLIILYPIINPTLIIILQIIGWVYIIVGIFTGTFIILKDKIKERNVLIIFYKIGLFVSAILTFFLIPAGLFIGSSVISELRLAKNEKKLALHYFFLIFSGGLIHFLLGYLLDFFLVPLLDEELPFLFPYVTPEFIRIVEVLGWISLISGILLVVISFFSIFLVKVQSLRFLILISSISLLFIYPLGTWYGLIIIAEFSSLKNKKKYEKE